MQVLCDLRVLFLIFNCQTPVLKKDRFVTVNHPTLMIYLYQRVLYKRGLFLFKEDF